ncbi:MAG: AAA family ATPase [Tissierellia bacterium]|nr:AAA family ATPase [Tissierellia bacterium]
MYFKELNLKSFGKFKDKTIHLTNGLNIIYGVNESGKSTINKFITGIMYGFVGPSKKRTIYSSDHAKYTPWIGDAYVGSILVDLNGTNIRIERNFSKGNEQLNIYDLNNGNDLKNELGIDTSRKVEQAGKALLGLSETIYLNTLNIAPLETTNDNSYAIELRDILKNKSESNIEDLSIQSSIQYLDNKQNELTKKTGPRSIEKEIQSLGNSIKLLYNSGIEYDRLTMELVKLNELVRNTEKDLLESRNAHQILNQINEVELHKKIDEIKIEIKEIEVNISKIPDFSFIDDDNYNEIERLFEERNRVEN